MSYPICRHILTTGIQCQSPALGMQRHCYFHGRQFARHANYRSNPRLDPFFEPGRHIRLNPIEDRTSLEMAISQVANALATGQIELKHGKAILYGLQLIANSISKREAKPELAPDPAKIVNAVVYSDDYLELAPFVPESPTIQGDPAQIRPAAEEPVIIEPVVCLPPKP